MNNDEIKKDEKSMNAFLDVWIRSIEDHELDKSIENNPYLIHTTLKPRFKYFKPSFLINIFGIKISFMWAYKIDKSHLFTNCRPSKIK